METSRLGVKQIVRSTLWVTVLVVRVGCIIEAHPSSSNSNGPKVSHYLFHQDIDDHEQTELDTAASHSFLSSPRNGLLGGGLISDSIISPRKQSSISFHHQQRTNDDDRKAYISGKGPILETTTSFPTTATQLSSTSSLSSLLKEEEVEKTANTRVNDDEKERKIGKQDMETDSCSGKADGYYQNLGSGCTSYYYCAAGYQITYVCSPSTKFNGKRCESNYKCPTTTADGHGIRNECGNRANGYYPSKTVGKYFYCFQQAKVIELQCDPGKIFKRNKCVLHDDAETITGGNETMNRESDHDLDDNDTTCLHKSNGFYQDLTSGCKTYYYCIGGEKHELQCKIDYIFNGDICVHLSRYQCPSPSQGGHKSQKSLVSGSIDRMGDHTTDLGKLPIIKGKTSSSEDVSYSIEVDISDKIRSSTTTTIDPSRLLNVP